MHDDASAHQPPIPRLIFRQSLIVPMGGAIDLNRQPRLSGLRPRNRLQSMTSGSVMALRIARARMVMSVLRMSPPVACPLHHPLFGGRCPSRRFAGEIEQYKNICGAESRRTSFEATAMRSG